MRMEMLERTREHTTNTESTTGATLENFGNIA